MTTPLITRLVRTTIAAPAQWDAWDEHGRRYYIRYRRGHLRVDATSGGTRTLLDVEHGDPADGVMDETEMIALTRGALAFSALAFPSETATQ